MRVSIAVLSIFVLVGLLAGTVLALNNGAYVGQFGVYGGDSQNARRADDPYSRQQYFGEGYTRDFFNYGSKGPTTRMINSGSKSMNSGSFNLDTNSFTSQGENTAVVSNWDPNFRGYTRVDVPVILLPVGQFELQGQTVAPKGTARIVSLGDAYGSGLTATSPQTQIFLTAVNLPPIDSNHVYEVWLVDEDTNYPLSIGMLQPGTKTTTSLYEQIPLKVTAFDSMMITEESYPSVDPRPSTVVLYGQIGPTRNNLAPNPAWVSQRLR